MALLSKITKQKNNFVGQGRAAPRSLGAALTEELCAGATGYSEAALAAECAHGGGECAAEAMRTLRALDQLPPTLRFELCRGAPRANPAAPVACVLAAGRLGRAGRGARWLTNAARRVALCAGAKGPGPADCVAALSGASSSHPTPELALALCRGATSASPGRCAAAVGRLPLALRGQLDRMSPAAPPAFTVPAPSVPGLCSDAAPWAPEGPALCLRAAPPDWPITRRVDLCRGAFDDQPAACAKAVLGDWPPGDLVELCRAAAKGEGTNATAHAAAAAAAAPLANAHCANAAPASLSPAEKIALCAGGPAPDSKAAREAPGPAACMLAAPPALATEDALVLCR